MAQSHLNKAEQTSLSNCISRSENLSQEHAQTQSHNSQDFGIQKNPNQPNAKKRKTQKLLLAAIAMLLLTVVATSGVITTNSNKSEDPKIDFAPEYNAGYDAGFANGKNAGIQEGFANRTQLEHQPGYIEGNFSGYAQGLTSGYLKGLIDGAGTGYTIRDPSYQEMLDFLAQDKTDESQYDVNDYNCYDFTRDVCNNASAAGIRIGDVYIEFPDSAHALICFNTTDRGLAFVEPQNDQIVTLEIGQPYFDRTLFKTPEYDDTVVSIGIIW